MIKKKKEDIMTKQGNYCFPTDHRLSWDGNWHTCTICHLEFEPVVGKKEKKPKPKAKPVDTSDQLEKVLQELAHDVDDYAEDRVKAFSIEKYRQAISNLCTEARIKELELLKKKRFKDSGNFDGVWIEDIFFRLAELKGEKKAK